MLLTIGLIVGAFVFGYFVGANNPFASVKAKLIAEAKSATKKL